MGIFDGVLTRGEVPAAVSSRAWLRAMLDVEAALAETLAELGIVDPVAARSVGAACADASAYDVEALSRDGSRAGNPVVPLVRAIEVLAGPAGARALHHGATSQDILDTAAMLVARRSLALITRDLGLAAAGAALLAERHRDSVMVARTLLQQAGPTTFGLVAAGWLLALDAAAAGLVTVDGALPVQLGGPVGTLAPYGGRGQDVRAALARRLGLVQPMLAWHTFRLPIAALAGSLAAASGVVGSVALDVVLLAQNELAEVTEGGGGGGSSSLPHKHNPIAAISARTAAMQTPGLAGTLFAAMPQELQRAAGAWHAEWGPLTQLLACTGTAVAWIGECLSELQVHPDKMAATLASAGEAMAAPRVVDALAPALGRGAAHDLVGTSLAGAGVGPSLAARLSSDPRVADVLTLEQVRHLLRPDTGSAGHLVDAALAAHRAAVAREPA